MNLELTDLTRLATQQSPGILLPLFLQGSDHRQVLPRLAFKHVLIYIELFIYFLTLCWG